MTDSTSGENELSLEKVLESMQYKAEISFCYSGSQGNQGYNGKTTWSPAYILSISHKNNIAHGSFIIDGSLTQLPIGFFQENYFDSEKEGFIKYYKPDKNRILVPKHWEADGTLYLPLCLTNVYINLRKSEDDDPLDGSPFLIYGIRGNDGIYPLVLAKDNTKNSLCYGIYRNKDGGIETYQHSNMEKDSENAIKNILNDMQWGRNENKKKIVILRPKEGEKLPEKKNAGIEIIRKDITEKHKIDWRDPKSIVAYLNHYVVGQEAAKKVIAVSFSNYMEKIRINDSEMPKDNLLLIGPTGVGKTYMISLLAEKAEFPMIDTKITDKVSSGYVGENLSSMFSRFAAKTNDEMPYGIIFIDEIDKLVENDCGTSHGFFGERKQDELIGWLEDATLTTDGKHGRTLSTKNILFVAAGTFKGMGKTHALEEIITKRICGSKREIGFEAGMKEEKPKKVDDILKRARPADLIAYGFKPELVGRLPALTVLDQLTLQDKLNILKNVGKSPLEKYSKLALLKGYCLSMEDGSHEIIAQACPDETGARALKSICSSLFTNILFEPEKYADSQNIIRVTPDMAKELITIY